MEGRMSERSRREYVALQRARYRKGSRKEKGRILDEGCRLFGVHRKSLIRAFAQEARRRRGRRGRPPRYGPELIEPLKRIWLAAEQPCAKRLVAVLPLWLPYYEKRQGKLEAPLREALLAASAATLDRLLKPLRARRRKGRCATRPVKHLEGQIPIRTRFQEADGPGYIEADTVAHCGGSMEGSFVWSVTFTDIWSGWTEPRAIWNRSRVQLVARLKEVEENLPFELLAFDSDNGKEFINHKLFRYLRQRRVPIDFTRSRPYRKNDQAHVEQKQWTHVRQLLGYDRLEDRRLVTMIDDLYRGEWRVLHNFFLPSMQLIAKTRDGGHIKRRHSKALTPYDRLLASPKVDEAAKKKLTRERKQYDPFELQREIEVKLKAIFRRARARRNRTTKAASAHPVR